MRGARQYHGASVYSFATAHRPRTAKPISERTRHGHVRERPFTRIGMLAPALSPNSQDAQPRHREVRLPKQTLG